ncbi:PaaI family thioesterase [Alloalcanivorax marinus]|uniref:PaaI family thioesterase n=1 Tax=Alloalcanivorax marinus TaxID=1177169 RepID=UPI001959F9D5|nr:PaaI family thioesterase [Alloalcanivorax marinus]MBM7332787.1 PaaI family thioesterase [Alloalcanivorax marinus]MCU5785840.1 uncharacterized protein [Alloalcanivorax marinus]
MTTLSDMTGLQALQHALQSDTHRGIGHTMEFALVELEEGRVVFEGRPTEKVYNPIGTVHGGYAATLLDSACGCAVHSTLDAGQGYSTAELKVAYHRAITKDTGPVRAEGKVVTKGRRLAFAEARLTDAAGKLYASATSTLILL